MPFRCVRDLKSQDWLMDGKMMVKFKAVAVVTLLVVWQLIKSPRSREDEKVGHIMMNNIIHCFFHGWKWEWWNRTTVLFRTKTCKSPQADDKKSAGKHRHLIGHLWKRREVTPRQQLLRASKTKPKLRRSQDATVEDAKSELEALSAYMPDIYWWYPVGELNVMHLQCQHSCVRVWNVWHMSR